MKRLIAISSTALLASCAIFDGQPKLLPPPPGFPTLAISYHVVPDRDLQAICPPNFQGGQAPGGCAKWNLVAGTCTIYLAQSHHQDFALVTEERLHCQGYTHPKG